MTPQEIHAILMAKAKEIGWPRLWPDDMQRILRILTIHRPAQFLWEVREAGADVFYLQSGLDHFRIMRSPQVTGDDRMRCFWWNGERLIALTAREAEQRLTKRVADLAMIARTCTHAERYTWRSLDDPSPDGPALLAACRTCGALLDGGTRSPEFSHYNNP